MAKIRFFPLDVNYKVEEGKPVVYLFGRTDDGKQICVLDDSFEPYFYVIPGEGAVINQIKKMKVELRDRTAEVKRIDKITKKHFGQEIRVLKVYTKLPGDVPVIKDKIREMENIKSVHEYDILFVRRYLMDKGIIPLNLYEVEGELIEKKSRIQVFKAEKIKAAEGSLENLRILAFDIETYSPGKNIDMENNPILMISFFGKDFQKVITWKKFKTDLDYVEFVDGESELIERFKEIVNEFRPDVLSGYFSDGFDLPYISTRAKKYHIDLDLGLDYSHLRLGKQIKEARIIGLNHLDLFKFVIKILGRSMDTETYKLDAVAEELLGEKKQEADLDNLYKIWDSNPGELEPYAKYNLHDSVLAYKLCEKMLPNIIELVKIVGLPIFDINRMGFSQLIENYLLRQAVGFNEIAPNKPGYNQVKERRMQTYKGAFVFEPKPGLYEEIVVFDYRSLYPTIIASHNVSPETLNCDCCENKAKKMDLEGNKYWFCTEKKGFIPSIIESLITRRMRIKEIMKDKSSALLKARQNSLKLLANSFYGYLGFFAARWYSIECARNVTAYGRYYIKDVIDKATAAGFKVLYSDSLPYDRRIIIETPKGDVRIMMIGELYRIRKTKGYKTLTLTKNQKVEFKPIRKAIRHSFRGKGNLLKIITKYGTTVVTNQHSVYTYDRGLKLVHAGKLKKGDDLISLTNPQIKSKYKIGHIFDVAELDLGESSRELRLYRDTMIFPQKKGKCPYCGKIAYLSSHVNLKHPERKQKISKKSSFEVVGAVNGKAGKIPRYWRLDEDLAWILGYYCADGSVSNRNTKTGRKTILSFGSQNFNMIKKVKSILDKRIKADLKIIKNYDRRNKKYMHYYRIQRIPIVALFENGFGAGKGSEFKKVPSFIFNSEEKLKRAFIQGYLDGDGNSFKNKRYRTHFVRFSTKSKELAIGLDFVLKSLNHGTNSGGKKINHIAWQYRKDKPKIQTLRLQSAKKSKDNFCLAEIREVKEVPNVDYVYDLEVEDSHNFVDAEGMILVHNTDSVFLALDGQKQENLKEFAVKVNKELPGLMELEYEGFYPRGIFVSAKMGSFGAKKKYALISEEGVIKIKGFEAVRRNWSFIAKEVQEEILMIILKEKDNEKALKHVKKVIDDLRNNEIGIDKVTVQTQLQKEIKDYDAVGPHVAVAQRMENRGINVGPGSLISFVIVRGGNRIRDRAKLPDEVKKEDYDPDYYVNNQVVPAVETIFEVLGYSKEDILLRKDQSKLESFM